jgi:hypothetical protein
MKKLYFVILVLFGISFNILIAQEKHSNTRFENQHKISHLMEKHLPQTEMNLRASINSQNAAVQQSALQALRDLERLFPAYPFDSLLVPLELLLKDTKGDILSRTLAALALEDLHSDAGDAIIKDMLNAEDKELQTLCSALMLKSNYKL